MKMKVKDVYFVGSWKSVAINYDDEQGNACTIVQPLGVTEELLKGWKTEFHCTVDSGEYEQKLRERVRELETLAGSLRKLLSESTADDNWFIILEPMVGETFDIAAARALETAKVDNRVIGMRFNEIVVGIFSWQDNRSTVESMAEEYQRKLTERRVSQKEW